MPNPYFIPLNCDAEIGMIIQAHARKKKQGPSTFVLNFLVDTYKKEIIETWGQKIYDELKAKYSMTIDQQKKLRIQKEREKLERQRKRLELKERELVIREANTGIRTDKLNAVKDEQRRKIEKLTAKRKTLLEKEPCNPQNARWIENKIKEIDEELKFLGVEP